MYTPQHAKTDAMLACAQGAAAAMFPFEDENDDLQWDEYGAALRPDEFQLKATSRTGGHTTSTAAYCPIARTKVIVCDSSVPIKLTRCSKECLKRLQLDMQCTKVKPDWHAAAMLTLLQ